MLLSVITICKDEPFIEDTCKSLCEQTKQDFEWLVIDGNSETPTRTILKKYEYRMQYFVSESDNGIFSAMNKGIRKASGTYLLFMNGGDVFYNNEVISQIYPYLEDGKAKVYYADSFRLFDKKEDCFVKTYPDDLKKSFFRTNTLAHQSSYIKRELFQKFSGYREDFQIVSDKEKWLNFIDNGVTFQHIPIIASCFRMNGKSRVQGPLLISEKKRLLEQYFPREELVNTGIPYLQQIFDR